MTLKSYQAALIAAGFDLGSSRDDGKWGPRTEAAATTTLGAYLKSRQQPAPTPVSDPAIKIPEAWLPNVKMRRIHNHWTAGSYNASDTDLEHYHLVIEGDLDILRGKHSIAANVNIKNKTSDEYAAHTLNANTGAIGVSLCCMGGAIENPFNAGKWPMLEGQWDVLVSVNAQLCRHYSIAVSPETVLSHAEVHANLGIPQRGKWDYTRLPFKPYVSGARDIGNLFRAEVALVLAKL